MDHFVKVTRSYWPGLFASYDTADLPRTNNALEQLFGSHRYHERRASGRKGRSPGMVLRGSVRLVTGLATRNREVTAADLDAADREEWKRTRIELEVRRRIGRFAKASRASDSSAGRWASMLGPRRVS